MYFPNYGVRKTLLDECLKNIVSEDPAAKNMVNAPKHCCNMDDGTFTIFIDHCEHESVRKSLF